ncbi:unnamed protein product [Dracunculus medinensis]|uniref:Uncharacterized protein n=1 Tax=Dracunculus medinensis TaxID=318479 RepID=A0A158Q4V3_DRAME|nr:unnamed protein product [Dracunculus medinensis]
MNMPPVPPPKPRTNHDEGNHDYYSHITSQRYNDLNLIIRPTEQLATRAHSALPATVRPAVISRPSSPADDRSTLQIEPDLIAKGRYDPASKCFSYAPARALNERFTTPKKAIQWHKIEDRSNLLDNELSTSDINLSIASSELNRRPTTPKWDGEIAKVCCFIPVSSKDSDLRLLPTDKSKLSESLNNRVMRFMSDSSIAIYR